MKWIISPARAHDDLSRELRLMNGEYKVADIFSYLTPPAFSWMHIIDSSRKHWGGITRYASSEKEAKLLVMKEITRLQLEKLGTQVKI